jgi:hypothetical protein
LLRQFIRLNERSISAFFFITRFEIADIKIAWDEMASAAIRPLTVEFLLKDGLLQTLKLDGLSYAEHQLFKPKLEEFLAYKKIPFKKFFPA